MRRTSPLGSAEKEVLVGLAKRGGSWAHGDRALWESRQWTIQLLQALTLKELVTEVVYDKQYKLTARGQRVASELEVPFFQC